MKNNDKFDYKVEWGVDLQTEHERYLTEQIFKRPVFVTDYPKEIKAFYMKLNDDNKTVAAMDLLVPGIGAQGGDVNAAVAAGLDAAGRGMIINSSRAIIFAGKDENFAQAAANAARATRDAIRAAKIKALS